MMASTLVVPRRFNGPPSSGNGGWTAGALAEASGLPDPVTVQVRLPPPLDRDLAVVPTEDRVELRDGEAVVALARTGEGLDWTAGEPVSVPAAEAAREGYPGLRAHPFRTCFACGPDREPGDGLRIFPGAVGDGRVASTWTPDASLTGEEDRVTVPVLWAALDCVGGWSTDLENRPMVLGQMTVRLCPGQSPPRAGAPYVVTGTHLRTEGRKTWTASHLFTAEGVLVAQSEQLWIAVDPEVFARLR